MLRRKPVVGAVLSVTFLLLTAAPAHAAGPTAVSVNATGSNGAGSSAIGVSCGSGGQGDTWNYSYSGTGVTTSFAPSQPLTVALNLDLHSEPQTTSPSRTYTNGFLGPNATATLTNPRGTVTLGLSTGACNNQTLTFNGTNASGSGTWQLVGGTGAYRSIGGSGTTGTGTFTLFASTAAPIGNNFSLALIGNMSVLQPSLGIPAANARWATASDFVNRKLTVTYTVRNNGPGDAIGVSLFGVTPSTSGVTVLSSTPIAIGDIPSGATRPVTVVYKLSVSNPPCVGLIALCTVRAGLTLHLADALDVAVAPNPTVATSASPLI